MSICKYALLIARRHPFYLSIYVVFLSAMGVFMIGTTLGGDAAAPEDGVESYQSQIALIDRDDSELSRALRDYMQATDELVTVEDESFALQGVLATSQVDAVLIIPEGFGRELMDAAHADDELPALDVAFGDDIQASVLAAQRAERWASLVAAEATLDADASEQDVLSAVEEDASHTASIELVQTQSGETPASKLEFYLRFSSYSITSSVVVVAGVVFAALAEPEVRRRQLASPVSTWSQGAQALAGCALLTLLVCVWVALVGLTASDAWPMLLDAPVQVALSLLALFAFALTPFSIAYLLSQLGLREEGLNSVANIGGMVMSFLGGAWVSLSLLDESVQAVARFTPTYWMGDAIQMLLGASRVTPELLSAVALDIGIVLLFAVAFASVGFAVARSRRAA